MKTIVFIAPQLQQPRVIKRISSVYNAGIPIKVYGFDSGIFSKNLKSISFPVTKIIKRNKKDSRVKKMCQFAQTLWKIKRENPKDSVFYIFSAELGNLSCIFWNRHIIYEEADIMGAYFKNSFVRSIFKWIDKGTIKRSMLTVFTSEGFVDYTFGGSHKNNLIVIPNKLNSTFFNVNKKNEVVKATIDSCHLKFGFVGIIRYPNTIVRFAEVIAKNFPQHEFHFYGDPDVESYLDNLRNVPNVFLHGSFVNPVDLPSIYAKIDIVISCYDTTNWNVKVAEPNKLYEAIFFETPIVVSKETFLEKQVSKFNAGFAIKADDDQSIIDFVNSIHVEKLESIRKNMSQVPWQNLVDNTELFIDNIKKIVSI